jgi:putative aldouronate transport system substrate-binding protein
MAVALAVGCTTPATTTGTTTGATTTKATTTATTAAPTEPTLSEKVTIELMFAGWVNLPRPDNDPYQLWINEAFNVDFVFNPTGQFNSEILTRFAANDPPDWIKFSSFSEAKAVFDEGVLLEDWESYLPQMPAVSALLTEEARILFTSDEGGLMFLSRGPTNQNWSPKIRVDWLTKLGLEAPKTDEELLEVAKKFTFEDPNGTGANDTYGLTSAGNNQSIGEITNFIRMYGNPGFHINDQGAVDHPIVNGDKKKLLDFVKKAVDEKIIDPDWYVVGWEDRKTKMFRGELGIMWYPGVIVAEIEGATENTGVALDWFDSFNMPKGSAKGGKISAGGIYYQCHTVSKAASEDKVKMDRIIYIMEMVTYPNEDYWKLARGVGVDNFELEELEGGYFWVKNYHPEKYHFRNFEHHIGVADWGNPIRIGYHQTGAVFEAKDEGKGLPLTSQREMAMDMKTKAMEQYEGFDQLLALSQQAITDANDVMNEFEIKYILGQDTDYDGFVTRWLAAGGQQLLDEAKEQWTAMGVMP